MDLAANANSNCVKVRCTVKIVTFPAEIKQNRCNSYNRRVKWRNALTDKLEVVVLSHCPYRSPLEGLNMLRLHRNNALGVKRAPSSVFAFCKELGGAFL